MAKGFIAIEEVIDRVSISRRTIYRWSKEGRFPRPVQLGDRASRWVESEIDAWLEEKRAERDAA